MKTILFLFLVMSSLNGMGQSSYSGFLGKSPITLVTYHYSDGVSRAFYVYDKYDTPIIINGNLNEQELQLFERNPKGEILASLNFLNFKKEDKSITGKWINTDSTKSYEISLKKDFDINYGDNVEWQPKELLQSNSTKNHYFKTIITKVKGRFYGRVSGVKIFEKRTDRLIQTIKLDCQLFGIDNVNVNDYNFDDIQDFSVFEASYAGPNTSRVYILKDSNSEKYFVSDFNGTSLDFDKDSKLIYEHNQCCAGRGHMNATYKVVNNKMVLIKQTCLKYDEEKEDYIETKCD
ncbi:MAG: hypothetical protein HRT69_18745 [Flavobacteriaceae bacterium]|nr:hypothetical protein [Flavobacteriaceae bacterium]